MTGRVALYGEVDMNLIDGSSIWLQSVAQMLASIPKTEVTVLLRVPERRDLLTAPLRARRGLTLVDPVGLGHERRLEAADAMDALARLDAETDFEVVLLRGAGVSAYAARRRFFPGRLWVYHLPDWRHAARERGSFAAIASAAERVLYQTDSARALLEALEPEHAWKAMLLPPLLPPRRRGLPPARVRKRRRTKLVYAGKIAPEYGFRETLELLQALRELHPDATLHVAGDKVHDPPADPAFRPAAERALADAAGLVWHGGLSRERALRLIAGCDVALCLLQPELAGRPELPTKLLDYGISGTPAVVTRTLVTEEHLGPDYPLFAGSVEEALELVARAVSEPALAAAAADRCRVAAERHLPERVSARIEEGIGASARSRATGPLAGRRILAAGHNLHFADPVLRRLRAAGASVREDLWGAAGQAAPPARAEQRQWADTIVCEWCLGNAVWYSRNVSPEQRLLVRFHRMELDTPYPAALAIDRVDGVVFVSEHIRRAAVERFGWPNEKLHVIPNPVEVDGLARPKLPGAELNLAMLGFVPARKNLAAALEILEQLRSQEHRFRLLVKGKPPWLYPIALQRATERNYFQALYERIERSPLLRDAVDFEPYGSDVASFFQKVGFVLSVSEGEGHQVALAEGMASGTVPVVLDRPGAAEHCPQRWIHESCDEAAGAVLELVGAGDVRAEGLRAREFAARWSAEAVGTRWQQVLRHDEGEPRQERRPLARPVTRGERSLGFCLRIAAPSWELAPKWGDFHLASALERELERRGHSCRLETREEWSRETSDCDVALSLRGLVSARPKGARVSVLWCISHPEELTPDECDEHDLVLVASDRFAASLRPRTSTPVAVMHQATDPEVFFDDPAPEHRRELVFAGTSRGPGRKILMDLLPTERDLIVWGDRWEERIPPHQVGGRYLPNDELRRAYSSAAIVLGDHWDDMRRHGFVSNRIYDALACGACVVSDDLPELHERFDGAVVCYRSPEELALLIDRYLAAPEERAERGRRGRDAVLRNHTIAHRADELLGHVGGMLEVAGRRRRLSRFRLTAGVAS